MFSLDAILSATVLEKVTSTERWHQRSGIEVAAKSAFWFLCLLVLIYGRDL